MLQTSGKTWGFKFFFNSLYKKQATDTRTKISMESLIPCFRVCLCCLFLSQQCHSRFPRRRMWGCCSSCWCPSARFRKAACNIFFWCFPSKLPWTFRQKKNLQLRLSLPSDLSEMHCVQAVQRWMRISTWKKNKKEKENKLSKPGTKKKPPPQNQVHLWPFVFCSLL